MCVRQLSSGYRRSRPRSRANGMQKRVDPNLREVLRRLERLMLSILHILVPVVFSERRVWAARYSARLAREFGSQLFFLNVGQAHDANTLDMIGMPRRS